jgi:hypothetical protein
VIKLPQLDNHLPEETTLKPNRQRPVKQGRHIKNILVATIYTILVLMVPWEELQGFPFIDRVNYLEYFLHEESIFDYKEFTGIIDYLKHETLWHYLIIFLLNDAKIPIQHIFLAISFLCIFSFSLFLVKRQGYLSVILLTNPLLITLAFSQLRLAFAFSILLLAYMSNRKWLMLISILAAGFIHTATFLFVGIAISIYIIHAHVLKNSLRKGALFSAFVIIGICVSIALGPVMDIVLSYFGDRRATIYTGDAASGIKYTLYWSGLLLLCAFQHQSFYRDRVNAYTIIILASATFNLLTGGYTSRLLAVSLPMILSSMFDFRYQYKYASIILYVIYISLQWVYWLPIRIFS